MAHKKGGGTSRNTRDSNAQRRGIKAFAGENVGAGAILLRQCGSKFLPGLNVGVGRDWTLFALTDGIVRYERVGKDRTRVRIVTDAPQA